LFEKNVKYSWFGDGKFGAKGVKWRIIGHGE